MLGEGKRNPATTLQLMRRSRLEFAWDFQKIDWNLDSKQNNAQMLAELYTRMKSLTASKESVLEFPLKAFEWKLWVEYME